MFFRGFETCLANCLDKFTYFIEMFVIYPFVEFNLISNCLAIQVLTFALQFINLVRKLPY